MGEELLMAVVLSGVKIKPSAPVSDEEYMRNVRLSYELIEKNRCQCDYHIRPCDGVLAGGPCDGIRERDEYHCEPDDE